MLQEIFYALFGRRRDYPLQHPQAAIGRMGSCVERALNWSPLLEAVPIIPPGLGYQTSLVAHSYRPRGGGSTPRPLASL